MWNELWTKVKQKIFVRRTKKQSRTSPDVQFREFSWISRKLDLEQNISELGKQVLKKSDKKQKINVKMPHVDKKTLARNGNLVQTKHEE